MPHSLPPPPGPLPPPEERAYVPEIAERYTLPAQTLYDMLHAGELPCWRVGVRKVCTSWPAVKAFFGEGKGG